MDKRKNRWKGEIEDRWRDDGCEKGSMDEIKGGWENRKIDGKRACVERRENGRNGGLKSGRMDRREDGWKGRWRRKDELEKGQMDRK